MIRAAINHACNKRSFADQTEGVHVTTAVAVQFPLIRRKIIQPLKRGKKHVSGQNIGMQGMRR